MIASAQKETQQLNQVLQEATALLQRNSADFGVEMEQVRQEVQSMRGRVDELNFKMEKLEQDLKLFKEDTDIRFNETAQTALPADASGLFRVANDSFKKGEHRDARRAYQAFLSKFPKDKRAAEAQFKLGETHFAASQWVTAISSYQVVLQKYGKSAFADDATYQIAQSFSQVGKCNEAALFYESVVLDFGRKSKHTPKAKAKMKLAKAGKCG